MTTRVLIAAVALTLAAVTSFPSEAAARRKKRVVIFYQSGYEIFHVGNLPEPFNKDRKLIGFKAGFKCKVFGLFWAHFYIRNCEPVAYHVDKIYTHPKIVQAIAAKYKQSDMKVGVWKKHGRWAVAAILIGAIGLFFVRRARKKKKKKEKKAMKEQMKEQK